MTIGSSMQASTLYYDTVCTASLDVDIKHPIEVLRPGHRCPALHRSSRVVRRTNTQPNDHFSLHRSHSGFLAESREWVDFGHLTESVGN